MRWARAGRDVIIGSRDEARGRESAQALNDALGESSDGGVVGRVHDVDSLLAEARRNTGLDDFGDESFMEGLGVLARSLDEETQLTLMGRILARSDIVNLLENRLQIEETYRSHPEIEDEEVGAPLVVLGLPRSGTSILHELLAEDPAHRVPLSWEARFPCPPPEAASYDSDPRIAMAESVVTFWNELVPPYKTMHEMGARIPCECVWLSCHSFIAEEFLGRQQVPSYGAWLATADQAPAYRYHRRMLKLLQWKHKRERWMLKAPSHMGALEYLLAEYPDARIIQTHRDPLKSMGSTASILSALAWMRSDDADIATIEMGFGGEAMAHRLAHCQNIRETQGRPEQFFDLRYQDMLDDPFAAIQRAYAHFGYEYSEDVDRRMRAYLAAKPQGKHGRHTYRFEDLGLDLAAERARFADYQARYDVPSEVV